MPEGRGPLLLLSRWPLPTRPALGDEMGNVVDGAIEMIENLFAGEPDDCPTFRPQLLLALTPSDGMGMGPIPPFPATNLDAQAQSREGKVDSVMENRLLTIEQDASPRGSGKKGAMQRTTTDRTNHPLLLGESG